MRIPTKRRQIRPSMAVLALAAALFVPGLMLAPASVYAAGGTGGASGGEPSVPGAAGGVDAGQDGEQGSAPGAGGGGGGAAANGGAGADARGQEGKRGGDAGATPGADGEAGEAGAARLAAGGGGGGAHGIFGGSIEILATDNFKGGNGGAGGLTTGNPDGVGAGGGGSGGYGAQINTGEASNAGTAQGGNGGIGGDVTGSRGYGGAGGDGGAGIGLSDGVSIINKGAGTAIGGNGGNGGDAQSGLNLGGNGGNGGAGILGGDDVVIVNQDNATAQGGAGGSASQASTADEWAANGNGGYGIFAGNGAHITNQDDGVIAGGIGGSAGNLVSGDGGAGIGTFDTVTIINKDAASIVGGAGAAAAGNLAGNGGAGVVASGLLDNSATISGGRGGMSAGPSLGGVGGAGVDGTALTILNSGAISGGDGASGPGANSSGLGGVGVMGSDLTITNSGTISGGRGGDSTSPLSGDALGGAGITGSALTITNSGTITGGDGGSRLAPNPDSGLGGSGVAGSDLTVINSGTISGGAGSQGIGTAIEFTGGVNRLELRTGYAFNGAIIANGTQDTLALGGATDNTFDASQLVTGQSFEGFEQLEKTGANTWTLEGDGGGFAGQTNVVEGTLSVNGTLGGTLDVLDGGRLGGTGTLGAGAGSLVTIANGGRLAPGNSIGTLKVDGDLVFDAGSIFEAEINPALDSDLVDVSGLVTINGGTVYALKAGGIYTPDSRWTIIDADGGVTGTFDALDQNMPFVNLALAYDANAVFIDVARNSTSFCDVAETANQCSTGDGLEPAGPGNPVYDAVVSQPDEDSARDALDSLSGEIHASARTAMIEDSRFVREAMNDRLRAAFGEVGAPYTPVLAFNPDNTPMVVASDHTGPVFWGRGFGSWASTESDGNAASLDRTIGGLLVGTDGLVGDWRIGLLAGYSRSGFDVDDRASSGSSDNYHVGLYGGTEWGDLAFRTGAAYTWHDIETQRSVSMSGFSDELNGAYNAGTFQAFGELGYGFELGNGTRLEPFANLAHVSLHTDSFGETGGAAALSGAGGDTDVTFTTLGVRVEHAVALGTIDATLRGMVGWRHALGDTTPQSTHAFSAGDAFTIAGVPIAEDAAVIEAGLDLNFTPEATFSLSYSGQIAESVQDHGFKASLAVKF